jgi:diadenosine tetraphosphate (Ap4A) HIT family hydrolase/DNA-binding XRE family transcriptional regulator
VRNEIAISKLIGSRIRDLRTKRGLTQEKLSDITGIDHKHIQLLEGKRPSASRITTIQSLTKAFGMSIAEFFSDPIFLDKSEHVSPKKSNVLKAKSTNSNQFANRKKLFEDNLSYAVYDIAPISRGHILIVPKRNFTSFFDSLPEEKQSMLAMIDKAKSFLDREYKPDGYNIGFNVGEAAGQSGQMHIHVIPRYKGDTRDPRGGIRSIIPM